MAREPEKSRARRLLDHTLYVLPILAVAGTGLAILVAAWGQQYVSEIAEREYEKKVRSEPVIAEIREDLVGIRATLDELEGNDEEIREQIGTVVQRLDRLIEIQLQER